MVMSVESIFKMKSCRILIFLITVTTLLTVCKSVHIKRLDVPPLVELGSQESVILDCEYTLDNSVGLVIKWFFNKKNNLVYQWIPPHKPQDLGMFKGKLDLGYKASQDPLQSHRALKILKPGPDMSGNYSCVVSTFDDEDDKSKAMLVFTPGKNFQLRQEKTDTDSVKLVCFAENVYPQPTISIMSQSKVMKDIKTEVSAGAEGLFDVIGSVVVQDDDLGDSEEFVCEMRVPQANYTARKQTMYYPGVMPTAQLTAAVDKALEVQGQGAGTAVEANRFMLIIFTTFSTLLGYCVIHMN